MQNYPDFEKVVKLCPLRRILSQYLDVDGKESWRPRHSCQRLSRQTASIARMVACVALECNRNQPPNAHHVSCLKEHGQALGGFSSLGSCGGKVEAARHGPMSVPTPQNNSSTGEHSPKSLGVTLLSMYLASFLRITEWTGSD